MVLEHSQVAMAISPIKPKIKLKKQINMCNSNKSESDSFIESPLSTYQCKYCDKNFTRMSSLRKHIELKRCRGYELTVLKMHLTDEISSLKANLEANLTALSNQIKEVKTTNVNNISNNINNNFNMRVYVSAKDDYLSILSDKMGPNEALEFVKDCGLSGINGDVKLLMKVYFDGISDKDVPIRFHNKQRLGLSYRDEHGRIIKEHNGDGLATKLGKNIQNTYLHGSKELSNSNQLPPYDMAQWITHTNNLCDPGIRRKVLRQLMNIVWKPVDKWD